MESVSSLNLTNQQINGTCINGAKSATTVTSNINGASSIANKPCKTEWVRLNIGGQYFVTTKTTLCKDPQSFFFKLCQDDPSIGLTTDKVLKKKLLINKKIYIKNK
jgi:hypothetical protein